MSVIPSGPVFVRRSSLRAKIRSEWKYDLAGRVFAGVPAPYNLPVPPYLLADKKTVRIGEDPPGQSWDFGSIVPI